MKKAYNHFSLLLMLITLVMGSKLQAQLNQVRTGQVVHEKASRSCIQVTVEPEGKDVMNAFQKYLKKQHAVNASGKKTMHATEVKLNVVSDKKIDLFAQTEKEDKLTVLKVFARLGYDVYLGPNEYQDLFNHLEDLVRDFSLEYLGRYYQSMIESEAKTLAKAQKSEAKHQSQLEKLNAKTQKATDKIKSLEEEIAGNEKEAEGLDEMLETDGEAIKMAGTRLESLKTKMANLNQ